MGLVLSALVLVTAGCEPAFSDIAPTQKLEAPMSIFPNNGRRGQSITVIALPAVPSPADGQRVYVVELRLPEGLVEQRVISNGGTGCTDERVADLLRLLGETTADRFPVCIEVEIASDAPVADADFEIELVADDETVISTATFSVLPALEAGQAG
jgi:hypothetical protein